eukprot:IDg11051t1
MKALLKSHDWRQVRRSNLPHPLIFLDGLQIGKLFLLAPHDCSLSGYFLEARLEFGAIGVYRRIDGSPAVSPLKIFVVQGFAKEATPGNPWRRICDIWISYTADFNAAGDDAKRDIEAAVTFKVTGERLSGFPFCGAFVGKARIRKTEQTAFQGSYDLTRSLKK